MTPTATIWRTCPVCGRSFGQPDDPGRKRVYCSRACQQAAYRARQRQRADGWQQRTGRQDQHTGRQEWRSDFPPAAPAARRHRRQRRRPAPAWRAAAPGVAPAAAECRQRQRPVADLVLGVRRAARRARLPPRPAAHERARRRYEALLRKAAGTSFEHEAAACRAKAEALRDKYGL